MGNSDCREMADHELFNKHAVLQGDKLINAAIKNLCLMIFSKVYSNHLLHLFSTMTTYHTTVDPIRSRHT